MQGANTNTNIIANGNLWEDMMVLLVVTLFGLLVLAIGRELLPSRKRGRRRKLSGDVRRMDPESVDGPIPFETLLKEHEDAW